MSSFQIQGFADLSSRNLLFYVPLELTMSKYVTSLGRYTGGLGMLPIELEDDGYIR